jgi:proline dehydrogenase
MTEGGQVHSPGRKASAGNMMRRLLSLVAGQAWLRKAVMSTPGIRDLAWRFVAGENLDAGITAVRSMNARGIKGTLNYIGTHVKDEAEAVASADAVIDALRRIDEEGLDSNLSVKLTQIGLDIDESLCRAQLKRILEVAGRLGNFVRIDMEESQYTESTLQIFEEMRNAFGADTVGIVLQSYLRDRGDDLERMIAGGSRIRLVKGGYWESAEIAFRRKADIENAFRKDLEALLSRGRHPAIATHDPKFLFQALDLAAREGIDPAAFELQFLYGVRPDLQNSLVHDGYTVRCYIPYGGNWYTYLLGCLRRIPGGILRRVSERIRPRIQ